MHDHLGPVIRLFHDLVAQVSEFLKEYLLDVFPVEREEGAIFQGDDSGLSIDILENVRLPEEVARAQLHELMVIELFQHI